MVLESTASHDRTWIGRDPISVNFDLVRSWSTGSDFIRIMEEEVAKEDIGYEYLK